MAIMARVQPESGWIVYAWSNSTRPIQFCFFKEDVDHIVQNRPRSDLDGLVRIWPNTSGLEASQYARIIQPNFWQHTTSPLPVSNFQTQLHSSTDVLDHCAKPAQIWFSSGWLCQVLARWIQSGSKPVCKNHPAHFWPTFPSQSRLDVN